MIEKLIEKLSLLSKIYFSSKSTFFFLIVEVWENKHDVPEGMPYRTMKFTNLPRGATISDDYFPTPSGIGRYKENLVDFQFKSNLIKVIPYVGYSETIYRL